jgi:lipid II:glycine glycyltransferase (peptidoglycan interpeptide bridge formation enzyme)
MTGFFISIDKTENNPDWDIYVLKSEKGRFFQTCAWAKVKQIQGWCALRVILKSPEGSICGGAQVIYKRLFGFMYLIQLVYGPLFGPDDQESAFMILAEIKRYFCTNPFFLFIQPCDNCWGFHEKLLNSGYNKNLNVDLEQTATVIIDVSKDRQDILHQIKKGKRQRFHQAENRGVICYESSSKEDLDTFYALHKDIADKNNFGIQSRSFFDVLWDQFMPLGQLHLFMAKIKDQTVAAILTISYKDTIHSYRIGWREGFNNYYPNEGIYWFIMQWANEHGFHWFDFGGIDIDAAKSIVNGTELEEWIAHTYSSFKLHLSEQVFLLPDTVEYINPKAFSDLIRWISVHPKISQFIKKGYKLIRRR